MKLSKISLLQLSKAEMERREQNMLRGGVTTCSCSCQQSCGCKYAGPQEGPDDSYYGGSSTQDNNKANEAIVFTLFYDNSDYNSSYDYGYVG